MQDVFATLLGTLTGGLISASVFVLQWQLEGRRQRQRARELGEKYRLAVEAELRVASQQIEDKLGWLSRDVSDSPPPDLALCVKTEGRLLYLGEGEALTLSLPFWDENLREIVETLEVDDFRALTERVSAVRSFVVKFGELKQAFQVRTGNAAEMALAVYRDLQAIGPRSRKTGP